MPTLNGVILSAIIGAAIGVGATIGAALVIWGFY
jgi:hypothetical protein